ncbi:hypothetical protein LNP04_15505 [Chryseobacterium sp. C-71]|uniref:hypothetical protein n=1 Tax=Chryseobacterium sp. C-71 TaxID=2893882 RepID=UPI001E2F85C8|nr:hypothetical protein [Chryseobacterium sp. C-71]UFH31359.1 hypothetical protein LNP04_15505 [Chryseobacterium sp. C-71]
MKKLLPVLLGIIFILMGTDSAKACSPVHTPFNQLLDNFDPTLNTAVEGYFISPNTFKVTKSYNPAIKVGSENKVFEYGPFGSQCEMYEMESGIDPRFIGAKNSRILFSNKDRSKNGKLVTPIFHGEGVAINGSKTVTFNHYVSSDKAPYSQEYRFSATLNEVRKRFIQQKTTTHLKWNKSVIKR